MTAGVPLDRPLTLALAGDVMLLDRPLPNDLSALFAVSGARDGWARP
jgi:hypothetical protein